MRILPIALGALGAIVYVGYFAYKVEELPLSVIVAGGLALMVYSFYDDMRNERKIARYRAGNGESSQSR